MLLIWRFGSSGGSDGILMPALALSGGGGGGEIFLMTEGGGRGGNWVQKWLFLLMIMN